jgi:Fe-S-cluster containining protein
MTGCQTEGISGHLESFRANPRVFGCLKCGNCCLMDGYVFISDEDIKGISSFLDMGTEEFERKYIIKEGNRTRFAGPYKEKCVFYADNECSIYPVRPGQCRSYPYWYENMKYEKYLLDAATYCPGIRRQLEMPEKHK